MEVKLDGKTVKAYTYSKRPENLVRTGVTYNGRQYSDSEIEILQMSRGQGFVKGKDAGKFALVQWAR